MRHLPARQNPLILPDATPTYEELLTRRRLGKTNLSVKPGQIGTSNATKPENLGVFEYAHLRAPLPKDLTGSEIFASHMNQVNPETYFLMRRSKDGYISATGMFKIAFPWALHSEERAEREYLKARDTTSQDEIAGNVWISPELALDLARDYNMVAWVRALLDPEEILQSPASAKKNISVPPKFELPALGVGRQPPPVSLPPPSATKNTRSRRSMSPSKVTSPTKKTASPRKPRQTKAMKEANAAAATAASATLQATLDSAASVAESESVDEEKEHAEKNQTVTVKVESDVNNVGDAEKTTRTNVMVEMPKGAPELPLPEDTTAMIEKAKEMVEEAKKLESESSKPQKKRKQEEIESDEIDSDLPSHPTKRAKVLEEKLKRQRVRTRAFIGISATLAIGAAIPYLTEYLPNLL